MTGGRSEQASWTFFSNHSHVLLYLAADGTQTLRDVAARVGITERAVQRIVADLEAAGVLYRERDPVDARRNRYRFDPDVPLRHPLEAHCRVGALIDLVIARPDAVDGAPTAPGAGPQARAKVRRAPRSDRV